MKTWFFRREMPKAHSLVILESQGMVSKIRYSYIQVFFCIKDLVFLKFISERNTNIL